MTFQRRETDATVTASRERPRNPSVRLPGRREPSKRAPDFYRHGDRRGGGVGIELWLSLRRLRGRRRNDQGRAGGLQRARERRGGQRDERRPQRQDRRT